MPLSRGLQAARLFLSAAGLLVAVAPPLSALTAPTGAPLTLSAIETEQPIPLAVIGADGKTASCAVIRLHWNPNQTPGPDDEATSFVLDIDPGSPGASIFTAQLWNASLASALAWQQPWEGARWKIFETPSTDGTGLDAALAVGMISTSARRPYPKDTVVIGSLKPDGTLGAVSHIVDRLDAIANAGVKRVIIPSIQRFDVGSDGQVVNVTRHAEDLHLECVPVDNLVQATEEVMHDPLPEVSLDGSSPKYNDISSYIDDFAKHEQSEMSDGLGFAPKESDLASYPPRTAAIWKQIFAENESAQQAYRAGQVYMAYRLFQHANGLMHGVNALAGANANNFDVRQALNDADDLRRRLHLLMNPPSIDRDDLDSALLVAEMADWAFDISAAVEGAQTVTRQTFSARTDATTAEKNRAREAIIFANAEGNYLIDGADFYSGLLSHVASSPLPVDTNAAHLLPQLIPAQLATAEIFTRGILPNANKLRDGLLFDPRLVAYIDVLKETKSAWEMHSQRKSVETTPAASTDPNASMKLNATTDSDKVGFDPGTTYLPPHAAVMATADGKKLSDVAACLIWVNHDCEIAALDEKYLHLDGTIDPATHEWHIKDRAKLDALLQSAESGARLGITVAEKATVDPDVLAMIFERASQLRLQNDDVSGLDALRNYWRCALLGNMCWQLAHTRKAEAVNLAAVKAGDKGKKGDKVAVSPPPKPPTPAPSTGDKTASAKPAPPANTKNSDVLVIDPPPGPVPGPNGDTVIVPPDPTPAPAPATNATPSPSSLVPPATVGPVVLPAQTNAPDATPPRAQPVNADDISHAPRAQPVENPSGAQPADNPPLRAQPVAGMDTNSVPTTAVSPADATTNATPVIGPPSPAPGDRAATGGD